MPLWRLAWAQVRGTGPLAAIASAGLLLVVVLLAVGPLYLGALQRIAFSRSLEALGNNFHPQVYVPFSSFQPDEYRRARATMRDAARSSLGEMLDSQGVYASTRLMNAVSLPPPGFTYPAFLQYRSEVEAHIRVVAGRLPQPATGDLVEVAMGEPLARRLALAPGQRFQLPTGTSPSAPAFEVQLVGVLAPKDLREEYWLGQGSLYFESYTVNDQWVLALFVPEATLLEGVGARAPTLLGEVNDLLYLKRDTLLAAGPDATGRALLDLEARLAPSLPQAKVFAALDRNVKSYQREAGLTRTPLLILLVLMETVALYALVLIALALSRRQEGSVALLRSRGASLPRAVAIVLLWGIGLAGLALVIAPGAAAGTVALLGYTPAWQAVTGGGALPPGPGSAALPWIFLGALLAGTLLLLPSTGVARIPLALLQRQRGRPAGPLWFQRLFLDVGLLLLAGILLWQVQQRGSVLAPTAGTGASVDRAALLIPALAALVGVLLFFRLFPLLVRVGGVIAHRTGPLEVALALERMGRAPGPSLALGGLLLLTATLGTFAATFGGTLDRSAGEQAAYAAGADARVLRPGGFDGLGFDELRRRYRAVEGVEEASPAYRTTAVIGSVAGGPQTPLLAMEPGSAGPLLWFRGDFAQEPLADLLARLALTEGARTRTRTAPEETTALGLWVRPENPARNRFLWLHLIDGTGTPRTYSLGPLDFSDWRYLEAPLRQGNQPAPPGPYTVDSIQVYETAVGASGAPGSLLLDELLAHTADGQRMVLDTFDRPSDWLPILVTGGRRDLVDGPVAQGVEHAAALRFRWGRETLDGVRGLYVAPAARSVPVLASPDFLAMAQLTLGQEGTLHVAGRIIPIRAVGIVDQFPTLSPGPSGFVVADGPSLLAHLNAINVSRPVWPNETFLDLSPDPALRRAALAAIQGQPALSGTTVDREALLAERQRSPLASAGWRGLGVLAVAASLGALAMGVAAHVASSVRERTSDMALLRALGLSRRRALLSFLTEHLLVASVAAITGVALGLWLSRAIIPLFQGAGGPAVPDFVLTTDWRALGTVAAAVLAGSLAAALLLWRTFITLSPAGILRLGQE